MIPYLLIMVMVPVLWLIIRPEKDTKAKKSYVFVAFGVLILLAGCRDMTVGIDTRQFCYAYLDIVNMGFEDLLTLRYEVGFSILCKMLTFVSHDYHFLIFATSVLIYGGIGYFCYKQSPNIALSLFLFVGLTQFTFYLSAMRQGLALSIMLAGMVKLLEGKSARSVLLILCAALFHRSVLIALLLVPLAKERFVPKTVVVYLIIAGIGFLAARYLTSVIAVLLGQETFYLAEFMGSNYFGALIKFLFAAFISGICINYFEIGKRGNQSIVAFDLFEHALMLWVVFAAMGIQVQILERLEVYFSAFALVSIPFALQIPSEKERKLIVFILVVTILMYFLLVEGLRPEWHGAVPYTGGISNLLGLFP